MHSSTFVFLCHVETIPQARSICGSLMHGLIRRAGSGYCWVMKGCFRMSASVIRSLG